VVRDPSFVKKNRASISHRLAYAAKNPHRVLPYVQRSVRDASLRIRTRGNHLAYYRAVMKSETARNPEAAVGSRSHKSWLAIGKMQFAYLKRHGLRPGHTMLEIGCGNLRAGRLFIEYLDEGHYTGVTSHRTFWWPPKGRSRSTGSGRSGPPWALVTDNKSASSPTTLRRHPRAQRLLALSAARNRRVLRSRRPHPQAVRALRLHLRQDRGRRTSRAQRGLLLPDRNARRTRCEVRPTC
jgi:hypothetical protein